MLKMNITQEQKKKQKYFQNDTLKMRIIMKWIETTNKQKEETHMITL